MKLGVEVEKDGESCHTSSGKIAISAMLGMPLCVNINHPSMKIPCVTSNYLNEVERVQMMPA